jgi:hypothetical protein
VKETQVKESMTLLKTFKLWIFFQMRCFFIDE